MSGYVRSNLEEWEVSQRDRVSGFNQGTIPEAVVDPTTGEVTSEHRKKHVESPSNSNSQSIESVTDGQSMHDKSQ